MLISEMVMREPRPSHVILRASKMLSQSNWVGEHYEMVYDTPEGLMKFLRSVPVEVVVVHNEEPTPPHQVLLKDTLRQFADDWTHVAQTKGNRAPGDPASSVDIYRLKSPGARERGRIRINLPYTLGRSIER